MSKKYKAQEFFKGPYLQLAQAIEANDMPRFKALAQGQDLTLKGDKDMDLMWFAIINDQFEAITTLVQLGVHPAKQGAKGLGSALDLAFMKHEDIRFLKAMLDGGLDPNYKKDNNQTLMLQRGVEGGINHVKLLLQRGTRLDDRDSIGGTGLDEAISGIEPDTAIYLVQQGADFNTYTTNGVSTTWAVNSAIQRMRPGNPIHTKYLQLRDVMISKGAIWPPLPPIEVRDQMRARGEKPAIPPGQPR